MFTGSQRTLALYLWIFGTILHFGLTLYILSSWIHQNKYEIKHLNPAWFIPVVGNILVPVVGAQYAAPDLSGRSLSLTEEAIISRLLPRFGTDVEHRR